MSTSPATEPAPTYAPSRFPAWIDLAAVLAAMVFPSIATWLYFVALDGQESMKFAFAGSKVLQFAFPLVWLVGIRGRSLRLHSRWSAGVGWGLLSGLMIAAAIGAAYAGFTHFTDLLGPGAEEVRAKVLGMGFDTPFKFAALATFYAVAHSLLEEYFWRWYVFGELRRFVGDWRAIALSSLGFMAHHVIVLGLYFRDDLRLALLLSAGVAIGGAFWAWLYRQSGSLLGPWLSHALVDAALMIVGYAMIWGIG